MTSQPAIGGPMLLHSLKRPFDGRLELQITCGRFEPLGDV
jgi:hypothetical protein